MDAFNDVIDIIFNIAIVSLIPLTIITAVAWWFMRPPRHRKTKHNDEDILARLIKNKTELDAGMLDAAASMLRFTEEVDSDE